MVLPENDVTLSFELLLCTCITIYTYTQCFLPYNEHRNHTVRLYDPLHENLPLFNLTTLINVVEYTCLATYFCQMVYWWDVFDYVLGLYCVNGLILTRMLMLWMCPLEASEHTPELGDRFNRMFIGDNVLELKNDLFFSGHVSSLVIMGLTTHVASWLFHGAAFVIGLAMTCSRIHYTIDVLVAPYIAYGTYQLMLVLVGTH